ncbi:hypothetical protein JNW88_14040, partial [Micromonospora sp. ATA32]|nr:hypothetical protein [Micromonospora sp. ATA32]
MPDAEGHGPTDGLPDLPPEWGPVVVPDDASALAGDAALLRRELRRQAARRRWQRRLRLLPRPGGWSPLALPLLILLVAVLTTAAGLLAVTWPRSSRSTERPHDHLARLPDRTGRPAAAGTGPGRRAPGARAAARAAAPSGRPTPLAAPAPPPASPRRLVAARAAAVDP